MKFRFISMFLVSAFLFFGCSNNDDEVPMVGGGTSGAILLLKGEFVNGVHTTTGSITVNQSRTELTIEGFKTDEGAVPLDLYLASDSANADFVTLGKLQGLEGNFTYDIPSGVDFSKLDHLVVWCEEFTVTFGHAVLVLK